MYDNELPDEEIVGVTVAVTDCFHVWVDVVVDVLLGVEDIEGVHEAVGEARTIIGSSIIGSKFA